jgi:hypothetical protein
MVSAQSKSYNQLSNEFQFARSVGERWSLEVWFGSVFSSTDSVQEVLKNNIQRYVFAWGNFYASPRWKVSASLAYFYNKDVPDIGQYYSPEWRLTLQGIYFIHKTRYTLSTRMRAEVRYIMNSDGDFNFKYRYRQQIKFMIPINSHIFRQGVFYFLTDEELIFKPDSKSSGVTFFDRNRFEIGGGYNITDDIQIEASYINEYLPRDDKDEIYNCLSLTFSFNNLIPNLKKAISSKNKEEIQQD